MRRFSDETQSHQRRAQSRARWLCSLGCVAALVIAAGVGLMRTQAQESFPLPAINPPGAKAARAPAAQQPAQPQAGAAAEDTSKPNVAKQCADLLKMATDLKAAVDKSSVDTLSVAVVRRAGQIEQLAHRVRAANGRN
jgi:hypothetical protein